MRLDRGKFEAARHHIERSQAWVARKARTTPQGLQHYLNGRPITTELYARFAAILGETDLLADDSSSTRRAA